MVPSIIWAHESTEDELKERKENNQKSFLKEFATLSLFNGLARGWRAGWEAVRVFRTSYLVYLDIWKGK